MSVHLHCDLCGRPLDSDHLADGRAQLTLAGTHERDDKAWIAAPIRRSTWHFCAGTPGDPTSCLSRALDLFAMGLQTHQGLEAIPVLNAEPVLPASGEPVATDCKQQLVAHSTIAGGPGGLWSLGLPHGVESPLFEAGVLTAAEVEDRYRDGTLSSVKGLGPARLKVIDDTLAQRGITAR